MIQGRSHPVSGAHKTQRGGVADPSCTLGVRMRQAQTGSGPRPPEVAGRYPCSPATPTLLTAQGVGEGG